MIKKVKVHRVTIVNIQTGDDPGDDLEIYGYLVTNLLELQDGQFVVVWGAKHWERGDGDPLSLTVGQSYPVDYEVALFIRPGQFLQVGGFIGESDTFGPNDDLGTRGKEFPYSQLIPSMAPVTVEFRDGNQIIHAVFDIWPEPEIAG